VIGWLKGSLFGLKFRVPDLAVKGHDLVNWSVVGPAIAGAVVGAIGCALTLIKTRDDVPLEPNKPRTKTLDNMALLGAVLVSLSFGFLVFKVLPESTAQLIRPGAKDANGIGTNYLAEVIKIALFIGYLSLIRLIPAIKEVFRYHGAEHKAINVIEASEHLTPENALAQTRLHPRCGTNFAIVVLIIGFLIFPLIPRFGQSDVNPILVVLMRLGIEIIVLPLIAGIAYEIIRAAGKAKNQAWVNILLKPGLMTQYITTAEPEEKHVQVAIASLESVMRAEEHGHLTNVELDPMFDVSKPIAKAELPELD
ncbi:MAG: DUF1385 domain-containing protein, partial [Armatimonadota bacterium]